MDEGFIIWDTIKESRDGFFVNYVSPRSDNWLASLNVVFTKSYPLEAIAEILEIEFKYFSQRYPTALIAHAIDDVGRVIDLSSVRPDSCLCGYFDPQKLQLVMVWRILLDDQCPVYLKSKKHLQEIYKKLPSRTEKQIKTELTTQCRQRRQAKKIIIFLSFLWLLAIPLCISFIEGKYTWIAILLLLYNLGKSTLKWLKLTGYLKKSDREIKKDEVELAKNHYYYHCEKNPKGFLRLKFENFDCERRDQIKKEMENLLSNNPKDD